MYSRDTEIRHLKSGDVYNLSQILDEQNSWKKLMRIIPKDLNNLISTTDQNKTQSNSSTASATKYTNDHIRIIENATTKQQRTATDILFDEWGTSGRKRPTVGNLLDLLIKAELFRAADHVANNILNEPVPTRPLRGPAARIQMPLDTEEINDILEQGSDLNTQQLNQADSEFNNKNLLNKIDKNKKDLNLHYSNTNLIKFSTINIPTLASDENIPDLSILKSKYEPDEVIEAKNSKIIITSTNINGSNNDISNEDQEMISENIPDLDFLNSTNTFHSNPTDTKVEEMDLEDQQLPIQEDGLLPNLSAFKFDSNGIEESQTNANSRSGSFGNSSSLSADDASLSGHGNFIPNFLLEKSNDDSSLTNVTGTSEDISFEIDGMSNSNQPDLFDNESTNLSSLNDDSHQQK